jgi:hypothetical protein
MMVREEKKGSEAGFRGGLGFCHPARTRVDWPKNRPRMFKHE